MKRRARRDFQYKWLMSHLRQEGRKRLLYMVMWDRARKRPCDSMAVVRGGKRYQKREWLRGAGGLWMGSDLRKGLNIPANGHGRSRHWRNAQLQGHCPRERRTL